MKRKHTRLQWILEGIGLLLLIGMIVFIAVEWSGLPDKIPGHYNAAGEVDRWGGRGEILILPIIAVFLYGMITLVSFFPGVWNMPGKIKEDNKAAAYTCIKTMIIALKAEFVAVFFFITYHIAASAPLPAVFLPASLVLVFGTIIYCVKKSVRTGKG